MVSELSWVCPGFCAQVLHLKSKNEAAYESLGQNIPEKWGLRISIFFLYTSTLKEHNIYYVRILSRLQEKGQDSSLKVEGHENGVGFSVLLNMTHLICSGSLWLW